MAEKKILLFGSGFVAQPCAEYILRRPENQLTIASSSLANAQSLAKQLPRLAEAVALDVKDDAALDALVARHDLVISLIPYTFHVNVIKSAIRNNKNVVTTSYVSDAMKALEPEVIAAGITVLNEIGVDPGVDHLYAFRTSDDVHKAGGKINAFYSYCGGLPAPDSANNPLKYKFSWSCRGSLLALLNAAKYEQDGQLVDIAGEDVMKNLEEYHVNEQLTMVAYPNRDSTGLRAKYRIPEAKTIKRGNLRYTGFPEVIRCLVELGFMSAAPKDYLSEEVELVWADITRQAIGAESAAEESLSDRIASLCSFSSHEERDQIMACLKWIGLFSSQEKVKPCGSLLDTLCATMEHKMQYQAGEQDMLVLQNKFEIDGKDGQASTRTQTLIEVGAPLGAGKGPFAMARLVGVPCGIAVQLILDGKIKGKGVLAPWSDRDLVDVLLTEVQKEGIMMEEKDL